MIKERDPRHEARRVALATLFERAFHSINQEESTARVLEVYGKSDIDRGLLSLLTEGVVKNMEMLDRIIEETAPAWPPDQIAKVDLIILRIAIFELVVAKNVPPKVAIDEAVEIAKEFGGSSSGSFVNGVLGTVVRKYLEEGEAEKEMGTEERVKRILAASLGVSKEELSNEKAFAADLNADPAELEDTFRRIFKELEIEETKYTFETVGQLIEFVKDYLDEIEE